MFDPPQSIPVFGNDSNDTYPKLAVGDLNSDGKPDLVTDGAGCNEPAETSCSTEVTVLLNTTGSRGGGGGGGGGGGTGAVFPGVELLRGAFTVTKGAIKLKVTCPPGQFTQCVGTDTLTATKAFAAAVKRKHPVSLGSAHFSISEAQTRTLTIRLTRKGLTLLAKRHKLTVLQKGRRPRSKRSEQDHPDHDHEQAPCEASLESPRRRDGLRRLPGSPLQVTPAKEIQWNRTPPS